MPIKPTEIKPLTIDDLDAVWAIEQQAHQVPWSESMIRDLSHQNTPNNSKYNFGLWLGDQLDNDLVGYVYSQNIVGEVTLLTIAVDPKHQGKGYGKQLVEHLISHSETENASSIWLEVRASNQGAYHLYESLGFNEIDRRIGYYPTQNKQGKEDAIIMNYLFNLDASSMEAFFS